MRLRISTILCLTLFALTNAAPSRPREEIESAKKDEQVFAPESDPFTFMSPEAPGNEMLQDCCAPGPACANPCQPPPPPPQAFAFAPPPPAAPCCAPGPACATPCAPAPMLPPPMPMLPPPPPPPAAPCCAPGPACATPCAPAPMLPPPMPMLPPPPPPAAPCCAPGPSCSDPCAPPMAPPMMAPPMMAPPMMAPPMMAPPMGGPCCDPNVVQQCANPCAPAADEGEEQEQEQDQERQTYAPYPGEITFKLMQKWNDAFLNDRSPEYSILAGNVENAIKAALEPSSDAPQQQPQDQWNPYAGYGGYGGYGQAYDQPQQQPQVSISNIYFREGYVPGNPSTMPITVAHVMVNGGSDDASRLQQLVSPDNSLGDGLKVYKDSFSAY